MDDPFCLSVKRLYVEMRQIIADGGQSLNLTNIVSVAGEASRIVERYPRLKGDQKKRVVCAALLRIAKEQTDDPSLLRYIETSLPAAIDMLISVSRKGFRIKLSTLEKFLSRCCCSAS
jgi:hypothetical protein